MTLSGIVSEDILAALLGPTGRFIEPGCLCEALPNEGKAIQLVLRTATAIELDVAGLVTTALQRLRRVPEEVIANVRTALHEALTNAMLHGNLGLSSESRGTLNGLDLFYGQMETALQTPDLAARTVQVVAWESEPGTLRVEVGDRGEGFVPGPGSGIQPPLSQPFGRGLHVIGMMARRCEWRQADRVLVMEFLRRMPTAEPP